MKKILIFTLLTALLASCSAQEAKSGKTEVFTSFYAAEDFVRQICGDRVSVINLTGSGDAHNFEISASQMAKLCGGDLFFYNGEVDSWAEDIRSEVEKNGVSVTRLGEFAVDKIDSDPHLWLDPDNAIAQLGAIRDALCEADPENSGYYNENYAVSEQNYRDLKSECEQLKAKAIGKTIIVAHGAYAYLCEELGLSQMPIEGIHGESDPTPAQMAKVIDFAKENNIKYIFTSPAESSKPAETAAEESGAQIAYLDSMEVDSGNGDYFEVMKKNIEQINLIIGE